MKDSLTTDNRPEGGGEVDTAAERSRAVVGPAGFDLTAACSGFLVGLLTGRHRTRRMLAYVSLSLCVCLHVCMSVVMCGDRRSSVGKVGKRVLCLCGGTREGPWAWMRR